MNVMIIAASSLPIPAYKGGATETLVTDLLSEIAKMNKSNLQIDVFSHCKGDGFSSNNVAYHFLPRVFIEVIYIFVMCIIRLMFLRRIYIPDIFPLIMKYKYHVDFSKYEFVVLEGCMQQVLTTRRVYKGKLVLHIHTVMTLTPHTKGAIEVCSNCDKLIGNSEYCSSVLKSITPDNIKKVRTVKNCIKIDQFKENDIDFVNWFKSSHSISNKEKCILFCGRLEKGKGVLELIQAFKMTSFEGRLIIVGSNWFSENKKTKYVQMLEKAVESVKERIVFTGYVTHSYIQKYYKCADFCVMPSIYDEAAGLVALEAQAAGIPVIVSDKGGISEFVHPESELVVRCDSKFVENLAKTINRLATDESLYNNEVILGESNVKQYDMEEYVKTFLNLFCDG